MEHFSVQNIINGNGIAISVGGMLIVFGGLLIISIYIALLPYILKLLSKKNIKTTETTHETLESRYFQPHQ